MYSPDIVRNEDKLDLLCDVHMFSHVMHFTHVDCQRCLYITSIDHSKLPSVNKYQASRGKNVTYHIEQMFGGRKLYITFGE